ncbi:MAG: helix-turn-helix transcriptional regulator [bacterium]|nr:helix-turn-helix transcriptional regulator [bacterium]
MGRHPSRRHASPEDVPVGHRIRERRRDLGMTQTHLAGEVYTKSFISQMESGHADPSMDTLRYLGRRLEMGLSSMAGSVADQHLAAVEGLLAWAQEARQAGRTDATRRAIEIGIEIATAPALHRHLAEACLLLAEVEIESGSGDRAAGALERIPEPSVLADPRVAIRKGLAEGLLALRKDDISEATAAFCRALYQSRRSARYGDLTVRALAGLGEALARAGHHQQARRRLEAAARMAARSRR